MSKTCRTLIIDDEEFARFDLIRQLQPYPAVEIIGEAGNLADAKAIIKKGNIDLIFLDIQMPGESGFDLLPVVSPDIRVIFVTAYDQYAIRAFDVNALDYLLKPVSPERLKKALEKLTRSETVPSDRCLAYDDCLFFKGITAWAFLRVNNISHIKAAGDYTEVFTVNNEQQMLHRTLKDWENRLPLKYFVRIHRESIININRVARIEKWSDQNFHVYLIGLDNPLVMSRKYFTKIKKLMM